MENSSVGENRKKERDYRSRGACGSRFSDADTSSAASGSSGSNIDRSRERRNCRIYISNIPYDYCWKDLKVLFRRVVGSVKYVELFHDENGKTRGCGIVEFKDPDNVEKALKKMNRYKVNGRELVVKEDHGEQRDQCGRIICGGGDGGGGGNSASLRNDGAFGGARRDDDRSESPEDTDSSSDNVCQKEPQCITQPKLNDLMRDLELSKEKSEFLASQLQQRNCLAPGVNVTFYRTRDKPFAQYFKKESNICFCNDIPGLFEQFGEPYIPNEWRLFIDGSKESFKAALLHIGNVKPSIPIAHAIYTKESYATMVRLLKCIQYEHYNWKICCDLRVVGILCGMQGKYTKHCCFLCLWDSSAREHHYKRTNWPERESNTVGMPLVEKENIIVPGFHIKLGLIKNFVMALDKKDQVFSYLRKLFPELSIPNIEEGVFDGPDIKKLIKSTDFQKYLSPIQKEAWNSFHRVVTNFLGSHKSPNYTESVTDLLKNYNKMGVKMTLKTHFLHSHLNFFPNNLGEVSDDHVDRFHQQIKSIDQIYEGVWDEATFQDYMWFLIRETDPERGEKESYNYFKHAKM